MEKAHQSPAEETARRNRTIVRTSLIGILANVLLAIFKALVGVFSHSIAITLDAVNNFSDAASSVITIVGTKLAGKAPDKKHPFGYGRMEYLSAMVIALIVLYAGVTSLVESVRKILSPESADYTAAVLIVVAAGVVVKIVLGRYVKRVGERVKSDSLINSGEDAVLDSVISASTLLAAVVYLLWGLSLEAWLGALISLVIIKSGIEMLRDTLSRILGERADAALAGEIKATVRSFPEVTGAYDLVLNNYGPDTFNASIHIGVPDSLTAGQLDELTRRITAAVYEKHGVILVAVGIYAVNAGDSLTASMRSAIEEAALEDPQVRELHGFYVYEEEKSIRFDLVISLDAPDRDGVLQRAAERAKALYPSYEIHPVMDTDFSEE